MSLEGRGENFVWVGCGRCRFFFIVFYKLFFSIYSVIVSVYGLSFLFINMGIFGVCFFVF